VKNPTNPQRVAAVSHPSGAHPASLRRRGGRTRWYQSTGATDKPAAAGGPGRAPRGQRRRACDNSAPHQHPGIRDLWHLNAGQAGSAARSTRRAILTAHNRGSNPDYACCRSRSEGFCATSTTSACRAFRRTVLPDPTGPGQTSSVNDGLVPLLAPIEDLARRAALLPVGAAVGRRRSRIRLHSSNSTLENCSISS